MKQIAIFCLSILILSNLYAQNLFEENYKEQNSRKLKSLSASPDTKVYRGWDQEKDNIRMLEDGFDLMGFSSFIGPNTPPSEAKIFAESIKADAILIYDRQINEMNRATAVKRAREKAKTDQVKEQGNLKEITINQDDLTDQNSKYDFYATFWAKLPAPLFGAHLIEFKEGDERANTKGLSVIAVIKDSAAFKSGLIRKDKILSVNGDEVESPDEFIKKIYNLKGQTFDIVVLRGMSELKLKVSL